MRTLSLVLLLSLLAAGCSWFREDEVPLEGKRVSVMTHARTLLAEPQTEPVVLPPARRNADWPQAGGVPSHNVQHLVAAEPAGDGALRIDAGSGGSSGSPLMAPPIVAAGRVFLMDTDHKVHAFDTGTGDKVWSTNLAKNSDDDDSLVGGLAFDQGRLYAATGFGDLIALNAGDGKEIWRQAIGMPMHGPPTVQGGAVFVITLDNVLHARSSATGSEIWPPRRGIAEPASLLGTANPAVDAGLVIAPFSSGEIQAVRADNGRVVWADTLGTTRGTDELSLLADIRARPIFDGQTVFAISYSGMLAAIDARSGQMRWDREIGGFNPPWLAGGFLFVVDNDNQLICLNAETGSIAWVVQLQVFKNEKKLTGPITWIGPVLASNRLIVFGSHGEAHTFSPVDGTLLAQTRLKSRVTVAPAIADGALFVLDEDGRLTVYR
ncbi:MAG: PQQ-binding-like beta-propeller repeat protein [Rhodospirillales bacterium]|nr:PQQ-binding-like beta-propeller repeat protein [Rhodospirillales bacterium]